MKFSVLQFINTAASGISNGNDEPVAEPGFWEQLLSTMMPVIMIAVFGLVFYFFILRPEKKRKKEAQAQRDAMRVGDTVITIGGITGEVESIRTETITIFTGNNSIDVQKWAIRSVEPAEEYEDDSAEDAEDETEA